MSRGRGIGGGAALLALALVVPVTAQEAPAPDLRKEIESLREMLEEIQKDVREIKSSLARRGGRPLCAQRGDRPRPEPRQGGADGEADARGVLGLSVTVLRQVRP